MRLKTCAAVLAGGLMLAQAHAADVEGNTSGVWVDYLPATAAVAGVGTPFFAWGIGFHGSPRSSLSFSGTSFSSPLETKFKVGRISYFNGTIVTGTGADALDLRLSMDFTTPALGTVTGDYGFTLINTDNSADPVASADIVKLPSFFSATSFMVGGTEYRIKLTGFENVLGDGFLASDASQFHVLEGRFASADLYAVMTAAPVPEPETYALMLAGVGLVAFAARRRKA